MQSDGPTWVDPTRVSLRQLDRQLQRHERSLFSCLNSILHDAAFVEEIKCLYCTLPSLANLRCGLWYVRKPSSTCYFKSTDGHNNNWSFSTSRLNLHVAELAAAHCGAVIVDATKKGKMAPDAFSKTIPIWACVINRAVAAWRRQHSGVGGHFSGVSSGAGDWDTELHLPLWISSVERMSIEERLEGFVQQLLQVGIDIGQLSETLHKPLRPLWVNQSTRILTNLMPEPADLAFLPLVLVSASTPVAASHSWQGMWRAVRLPDCDEAIASNCEGGVDLLCQSRTQSYCYVPGAGDDEETWACGLTPDLLWKHWRRLVASGPAGVRSEVEALVKGSTRHDLEPEQSAALSTELNGAAEKTVAADEHHPLPKGCANGMAHGFEGRTLTGPPGVWRIGDTGLALGDISIGEPPAVWEHVEAVLNCGLRQHPALTTATCPGAQQPLCMHNVDANQDHSQPSSISQYCWLPVKPAKADRHSLTNALEPALRFTYSHLRLGRRVLIHCDSGHDVCVAVAVAVMLRCFTRSGVLISDTAPQAPLPPIDISCEEGLTKDSVWSRLALLSRHYPMARPTRGTLKQVFNFFHTAKPLQRGPAG